MVHSHTTNKADIMKNQATKHNQTSKTAMQEMAKRMYRARFNELRSEGLSVRKASELAYDELEAIIRPYKPA